MLKQLKQRLFFLFLLWFCLGISVTLLTACISEPPKPFSNEALPTEAIAEITEIPSRPVWIRFINSKSDSPIELGAGIKAGESVRTAVNSRTQISLKNGVILRLAGDSDLKINDKYQIQLNRGRIVALIGKDLMTEITTNKAIATFSNATIYIELPNNKQEQQFFVLQGTATVRLKNTLEPIILKTGQNLIVKSDGTGSTPTNLGQADLDKRFGESKLLSGFSTKLAGQAAIEANFKISKAPETVNIPYNRPAAISESPAYYESNYERSPKKPEARTGYRNRDEAPSSTSKDLEPKISAPDSLPVAQPIAEPPPLPAQPEALPVESPPIPVQPETEAIPP